VNYGDHRMETLTTIYQVIEKLGGTTEAARILGENPSTVSNWIARNAFPGRKQNLIEHELMRIGYRVEPTLVGLPANDKGNGTRTSK
jgi:hypothetical protein